MINLEKVKTEKRGAFLPFLLMGDESEEIVKNYLEEGALIAVKRGKK